MAYRIGQIRKNNNTSYLTDLAFTPTTIKTAGISNKVFDDYAIRLNGENFNANNTYYLRGTIKRINWNDERFGSGEDSGSDDPRKMNIKIELYKTNGDIPTAMGIHELGTYQTLQSSLLVDPYISNYNSEDFSFELIFTPNDEYTYLAFVLSRVPYDYVGQTRADLNSNTINLDDKGDICIINNILPIASVDKIGVQSRPGSLICVNREAIRISKSGTYEVNNGVPVTYVGFVGPNGAAAANIDKFILDYAWDE